MKYEYIDSIMLLGESEVVIREEEREIILILLSQEFNKNI